MDNFSIYKYMYLGIVHFKAFPQCVAVLMEKAADIKVVHVPLVWPLWKNRKRAAGTGS